MNTFAIFVATVCLAVGAFAADDNKAGDHHHHHHHEMKCQGTALKLSDAQNKTMGQCWTKIFPDGHKMAEKEPNTKDPKDRKPDPEMMKKFMCMAACKAQGFGLIDATGKVQKDKVAGIVSGIFPAAAAADITAAINTCADQKGANIALKEGDCSTFEDFAHCIKESVHKICDKN